MHEGQYNRVQENFERAVSRLQENLEYLEEKGKVSRKFLSMQKLFIKALNDYKEEAENYIDHLEWENQHLNRRMVNEYQRMKNAKVALEAICLIHGINDLACWLAKGRAYLISMAIEMNKEGSLQLPSKLMEYIDGLTKEDQAQIRELLWKKHEERMKKEIQALEQQIKETINARKREQKEKA